MPDGRTIVLLRDYSIPDQPQLVEAVIVALDRARDLPQATAWRPELHAHQEQDSGWDWNTWVAEADLNERESKGRYESYVLLRGEEVQALMLIELGSYASRGSGRPLIYIEYVSVAPANRRSIRKPPKLGGCGTAIIGKAIERSVALGYGGTIGLHALPQAVEAYERMGLKNFGLDPLEGLNYFES